MTLDAARILALTWCPWDDADLPPLKALGLDGCFIRVPFAACCPERGSYDVFDVARQVQAAREAGLFPVLWGPVPATPKWTWGKSEYAYRRWDGAEHWGHTPWGEPHRIVANLHHPDLLEAVTGLLKAIVAATGPELAVCLAYGSEGEMIGPTYSTPELDPAVTDLWLWDDWSRGHFEAWYGLTLPRTWHEADWRAADFLSRRMFHWAGRITRELPEIHDWILPLLLEEDACAERLVACGGSAQPHWMEHYCRELAARRQQGHAAYLAPYWKASPRRRMHHALMARHHGYPVFAGAEGLGMARTAALARVDGYHGLLVDGSKLTGRTVPPDVVREIVATARRLLDG